MAEAFSFIYCAFRDDRTRDQVSGIGSYHRTFRLVTARTQWLKGLLLDNQTDVEYTTKLIETRLWKQKRISNRNEDVWKKQQQLKELLLYN